MSKNNSLEKFKSDAAETVVAVVSDEHQQNTRNEVMLSLGAMAGMKLVTRFMSVSTVEMLREIRDKKKYKSFGYTSFEQFLETDPYAVQYIGISYKTFNNLDNQLEAEGETLYELLNDFRIPISSRKLLQSAQMEIVLDGNQLVIGGESYDLEATDAATNVKDIIKSLAKESKKQKERADETENTVKKLKEQIETGAAEFDELRRAVDAQSEGPPYQQALGKAIAALINLTNEANKLPLVETQMRGQSDVAALWEQMKIVRDALQQPNFVFTEEVKMSRSISKRAMLALAKDDDFGDEDEQ